MNDVCPICETGHLTGFIKKDQVTHRGIRGRILMKWSECDYCGIELTEPSQVSFNTQGVRVFREDIDSALKAWHHAAIDWKEIGPITKADEINHLSEQIGHLKDRQTWIIVNPF